MRAAIFCAALAGNVLFLATGGAPAVAQAIHRPARTETPNAARPSHLSEIERTEPETRRDPREGEPETAVDAEEKPAAAPPPATTARKPAPAPTSSSADAVDPKQLELALTSRVDELPMCRRGGGPEGPGVAEVLFLPEGRALVRLSEPYAATSSGACIARRLGAAARPFEGAPVALRVRFSL